MTLESIWDTIRGIVEAYEAPDGTKYEPARDPFTFEMDPRGDVPAYYIDPPQVDEGEQYIGGERAYLARCSIWLSRPRSEDADGRALRLATDCGELRRRIDAKPVDCFVHPGASVKISTGDAGNTTVIGTLAFVVDFEEV